MYAFADSQSVRPAALAVKDPCSNIEADSDWDSQSLIYAKSPWKVTPKPLASLAATLAPFSSSSSSSHITEIVWGNPRNELFAKLLLLLFQYTTMCMCTTMTTPLPFCYKTPKIRSKGERKESFILSLSPFLQFFWTPFFFQSFSLSHTHIFSHIHGSSSSSWLYFHSQKTKRVLLYLYY